MVGGELGQIIHKPLLPGLLGDVRVLHIHEVALIKPADGLVHTGSHAEKAAGAELDGRGHTQVRIQHGVPVAEFLQPRHPLPRRKPQNVRLALGQNLHPAVREKQLRGGHYHLRVTVQPVADGGQHVVINENIRVQHKVIITVQQAQHMIVPLAEAQILRQPDDLHVFGKALPLQRFAGSVRAGVVHQIDRERTILRVFQQRFHRPDHLVGSVIAHDAGADLPHWGILQA